MPRRIGTKRAPKMTKTTTTKRTTTKRASSKRNFTGNTPNPRKFVF